MISKFFRITLRFSIIYLIYFISSSIFTEQSIIKKIHASEKTINSLKLTKYKICILKNSEIDLTFSKLLSLELTKESFNSSLSHTTFDLQSCSDNLSIIQSISKNGCDMGISTTLIESLSPISPDFLYKKIYKTPVLIISKSASSISQIKENLGGKKIAFNDAAVSHKIMTFISPNSPIIKNLENIILHKNTGKNETVNKTINQSSNLSLTTLNNVILSVCDGSADIGIAYIDIPLREATDMLLKCKINILNLNEEDEKNIKNNMDISQNQENSNPTKNIESRYTSLDTYKISGGIFANNPYPINVFGIWTFLVLPKSTSTETLLSKIKYTLSKKDNLTDDCLKKIYELTMSDMDKVS